MNPRPRIILCSLLKPVFDPRMYEKLGLSLATTDRYEVIIIGRKEPYIPGDNNIRFLPVFRPGRLSPARFFSPLKLLILLLKLKPQVIINNSVDFLLIISFYKILAGSKVIYDVQEDYYCNIRFNRYFPSVIRILIAWSTRSVEWLASAFTDYFLLAEKAYLNEIGFLKKKRSIVLENKYTGRPSPCSRPACDSNRDIHFLFSGTIAEHYGIFEIIEFMVGFHSRYDNIHLDIIGYCAHRSTLNRINERIHPYDFIHLHGGDQPVPHNEIIEAIRSADAGIIHYHINPSTENRFPTRLFEYAANCLPILAQPHKPWADFVTNLNAGLIIDVTSPDYDYIYKQLISNTFYQSELPGNIFWDTERVRFLDLIASVFQSFKQ